MDEMVKLYIQQDFSWATLMAMLANITSFCLASTFDTLPSPTNLGKMSVLPHTF